MSDEDLPESDRADDAPHPRATLQLFGHVQAETEVLDAISRDKLHHAWMITGPSGIGKATLAWHMARHLIATPPNSDGGLFGETPPAPTSLDISPDHPVTRRILAMSEPGLLLLRRAWDRDRKRLKAQITVDEVRKLGTFFGLSSTDGGRRVVLVDSVDEMNPSAANALLKVLEEPPKNAILLLISHAPARLLPTIRSRCRELRLNSLNDRDMTAALTQAGFDTEHPEALTALANGSVGQAIRLLSNEGPALYQRIVNLLAQSPAMDRTEALKLAEYASQRGADDRLNLTVQLMDQALSRAARIGTGLPLAPEAIPNEHQMLTRLAPNLHAAQNLAQLQQDLSGRIAHGRAVNVDAQSLLLDALLKINDTAPRY